MTPHLATPGLSARVAPFVEACVLTLGEVHVVDRLAVLATERDVDVLLGLAFAVRAPRVGHTGVDLATLQGSVATTDGPAGDLPWPERPLAWRQSTFESVLVARDDGHVHPFTRLGSLLQTARMADFESRLATAFKKRCGLVPGGVAHPVTLRADLAALFGEAPPGDAQRLAAVLAVLNRTAVISGGPGTGKTTTVRKVLCLIFGQAIASGSRPPRVAMAAPTGKAAARMREALLASRDALPGPAMAWIETLPAVTLHRLLGFRPATPGYFRHDRDNPLPYDLVVVDEASMIDVAMMCRLVEAVDPEARLLLLGDRNQLASVEAGCVLADLTSVAGPGEIRLPPAVADAAARFLGPAAVAGRTHPDAPRTASGMIQFDKAYRFDVEALRIPIYALADASAHPENASGHLARAVHALTSSGSPAVRTVPLVAGALDPRVLDEVVATYGAAIGPLRANPSDVRAQRHALDALGNLRVLSAHRRGPSGVVNLNERIARRLRADDAHGRWWVGRVVLVNTNDYDQQLWNGDVGVATQTNAGWGVAFSTADGVRVVPVPSLPEHETAFAMTIHKSQGSQFRHAVVVLPDVVTALLTRELVYTGISRASHQLTVCASEAVLAAAVERRVVRASGLGIRLGEGNRVDIVQKGPDDSE